MYVGCINFKNDRNETVFDVRDIRSTFRVCETLLQIWEKRINYCGYI